MTRYGGNMLLLFLSMSGCSLQLVDQPSVSKALVQIESPLSIACGVLSTRRIQGQFIGLHLILPPIDGLSLRRFELNLLTTASG